MKIEYEHFTAGVLRISKCISNGLDTCKVINLSIQVNPAKYLTENLLVHFI
jgi:hypothetical protein